MELATKSLVLLPTQVSVAGIYSGRADSISAVEDLVERNINLHYIGTPTNGNSIYQSYIGYGVLVRMFLDTFEASFINGKQFLTDRYTNKRISLDDALINMYYDIVYNLVFTNEDQVDIYTNTRFLLDRLF